MWAIELDYKGRQRALSSSSSMSVQLRSIVGESYRVSSSFFSFERSDSRWRMASKDSPKYGRAFPRWFFFVMLLGKSSKQISFYFRRYFRKQSEKQKKSSALREYSWPQTCQKILAMKFMLHGIIQIHNNQLKHFRINNSAKWSWEILKFNRKRRI